MLKSVFFSYVTSSETKKGVLLKEILRTLINQQINGYLIPGSHLIYK